MRKRKNTTEQRKRERNEAGERKGMEGERERKGGRERMSGRM
jgi:hypothetical protein